MSAHEHDAAGCLDCDCLAAPWSGAPCTCPKSSPSREDWLRSTAGMLGLSPDGAVAHLDQTLAHNRDANAGLFQLSTTSIAVTSDDCYTPRWVFDAMGLRFDLDVAAPVGGPRHVPAARHYTAVEDGLTAPWEGVVWCNPPYSKFRPWAERWSKHDRGALMGMMSARSMGRAVGLWGADAVAFIDVQFERPDQPLRDVPTAIFVAFRGVGVGAAERLAAADPRGAVLYGRAAA